MIDPARVERLHRLLRHRPVVATLVHACRQAGGVPVHLVGGLLRDRLLGLPSRDYDAVVAGRGREVAAAVAERLGAHLVHLGGKDFAAYRVVGSGGDDWVLDVWDREDQPLRQDLARRDLTVNSFALDLADEPGEAGRFVDPFGGVADLERRVLRATTETSFTGDPLRVLRVPRLLIQLPGFTADPATLRLARSAAAGLASVAAERVREELVLIFQRPAAHRAFGLLVALDLYPGLWRGDPGVAATAAGERRAARAVLEMERVPERAREVAVITAAAGASGPGGAAAPASPSPEPAGPGPATEVDLLATRYALAFLHLPREEGSAESRTAAAVAALERFRDAGYATRSLADRGRRLVAAVGVPAGADHGEGTEPALPATERDQRRFLHALGELWPAAAVLAGVRPDSAAGVSRWREGVKALGHLLARDGERILDPPRLLTGQEVQETLGVEPGPRVGEALAAVRAAQVDGEVGSREEALELLQRRFPAGGREAHRR